MYTDKYTFLLSRCFNAEWLSTSRDCEIIAQRIWGNVLGETKKTSVESTLHHIRQMIIDGELLPGEKVHQSDLAVKLNMSRIPVREALSSLHAEGILVYKPNVGFTVARFKGSDLVEIYLMRRLLETALIRSINLSLVNTEELSNLNQQLAVVSADDPHGEFQERNQRFHFRFFEYSDLALVRKEVERLWYMSTFYRSLYIQERGSPSQIIADHERIIQAIQDQDVEAVIQASDDHRGTTEVTALRRFG